MLHGVRDGPIDLPQIGPAVLHQEVPFPWTVLTAMFMHGGWLHILGNMWFLWIFGEGIEGAMGSVRLPAWALLGFWFVSQFFVPLESGVASMAHVEGFVAGLLGARLFASAWSRPRSRSGRTPANRDARSLRDDQAAG